MYPCHFCYRTDAERVQINKLFYIICPCGIARQNPMPSREELDRFYQEEYRDGHPVLPTDGFRADWIVSNLPEHGTLLDVGCGTGLTLKRAKAKGWDVEGVEPDEKTRAECQQYGKIYADLSEVTKHYDWLVASHVIEHTPEPLVFVKRLKKLADNFIFIIPIDGYGIPHLHVFNQAGFALLLEMAGYEILKSGYAKGIHHWVIANGA